MRFPLKMSAPTVPKQRATMLAADFPATLKEANPPTGSVQEIPKPLAGFGALRGGWF